MVSGQVTEHLAATDGFFILLRFGFLDYAYPSIEHGASKPGIVQILLKIFGAPGAADAQPP